MYRTVVWATDGSDGADGALHDALALVAASDGKLVVAHCDQRATGRTMASPALPDEEESQSKIRRQVDELRDGGIDAALVVRSSFKEPADVVAGIAEDVAADVIVCGTRGLRALAGVLLGSFTQRLLRVSPCPVLAVPDRVRTTDPVRGAETKARA